MVILLKSHDSIPPCNVLVNKPVAPLLPNSIELCYSTRRLSEALLYLGGNNLQQIFTAQIGTGCIIRESTALCRSCQVNRAALIQLAVRQEDAGAVLSNLEGIAFLYVHFTYFAIADMKMSGDPVDIDVGDKESGARQPVTAESRTIVAESSEPGGLGWWSYACHI